MTAITTVITVAATATAIISLLAFSLRVKSDRTAPQLSFDARGTTVRVDRVADVLIGHQ